MARAVRTPIVFRFTAIGKRLRKLNFTSVGGRIELYSRAHVEQVVADVRQYPSQSATSTYERTYTLRDSWDIDRHESSGSIFFTATNDATDPRGRRYARYAHGPGTQPSGFQSRALRSLGWRNLSDYTRRQAFRSGVQALITERLIK